MQFPFFSRQARLAKATRRKRLSRQISRGIEQLEDRRLLSTIPVTLASDAANPVNDGKITIREAIAYVNGEFVPPEDRAIFDYANLGTNDTILFDPDLDGETIVLSAGQLEINRTVEIYATDLPGGITIDGNHGSRVFNINNYLADNAGNYNITLAGITIEGGEVSGDGGNINYSAAKLYSTFSIIDSKIKGGEALGNGGGVYCLLWDSYVTFSMIDSIIEGNDGNLGGGLYVSTYETFIPAEIEVVNSRFVNNTASEGGGAYLDLQAEIVIEGETIVGETTIEDCTFHNNEATGDGGGIYITMHHLASPGPTLNLINSTVSGNTSTNGNGGGVCNNSKYGTFNYVQCTISGNKATGTNPLFGAGGGLWIGKIERNESTSISNIDHTTITNNHAATGGGLYSEHFENSEDNEYSITTLSHTIVSGNDNGSGSANNIAGAINSSSSYNLIGAGSAVNPTGAGNIYNDDPRLRDLGYYGGHTQTHMPYSNSAVIDAGNQSTVAELPENDQRGAPYDRVIGDDIDIGAVEYNSDDDPSGPPTIVDIIISSSKLIHDPYSFAAGDDPEEGPVVGSGDQLITIPVGGADTVDILFSEYVILTGNELSLYGAYTSTEYELKYLGFDNETFSAAWKLASDVFPADQIVLTIDDTVKDIENTNLDGDWTNPYSLTDEDTSIFPSGDGTADGDFEFFMTFLPGDADLDNKVGPSDLAKLGLNWDPAGNDNTFQDGDFNGDGAVGPADLALIYLNWNPSGPFTTWPTQQASSSGGDSGLTSSPLSSRGDFFEALSKMLNDCDWLQSLQLDFLFDFP